jgi:hypothetical protein
VREYTNLVWPDTPFGADKRPWPRKVHLIAATAVQWAADGEHLVPAATALVYLPVRRAGTRPLLPETLHFGYRVTVIDDPRESPDVVALIDGHLVQGRRHAAVLAVHRWDEDADMLRRWAAVGTPGITATEAAWADRVAVERGTARLVETSRDIGHASPLLPAACQGHGLGITHGDGGLLSLAEIQAAFQQVRAAPDAGLDQGDRDRAVQALGLSALCQGLVTALLAGEATGRCTWSPHLPVYQVLANAAWDAFPDVLPHRSPARAGGG